MRDVTIYRRQIDLVPIETLQKTNFTIIGVGSLGSFITTILAHMGAERFNLYDDDKLEEHNLPVQFLHKNFLGQPKVEALKAQLEDWYNVSACRAHNKKFKLGERVSSIVISGVDSLEARRDIWEGVKSSPRVQWYIDTRAGGLVNNVYTLDPRDPKAVEAYEESIKPDDEILPLPCTQRMSTFIASQTGSMVANIVMKLLKEEHVPFRLVYDADGFSLRTTNLQKDLKTEVFNMAEGAWNCSQNAS